MIQVANYVQRDEIIFGRKVNWLRESIDGIINFHGLTVEQLHKILDNNHADPRESYGMAPCIEDFLDFMKDFPIITAHGYVVSPDRPDYRFVIEGLHYEGRCNDTLQRAFFFMCSKADDIIVSEDQVYALWK
jgi:hypothetical protein